MRTFFSAGSQRRSTAVLLVLLLLLPAFAAGCRPAGEQEETQEAVTEISLWHYWDLPSCQRAISRLAADFNASQDRIVVKVKYVPDEDFKKQLALSMAEDAMPDIAVVDSSDFHYFHSMKEFYELTGKLDGLEEYMPEAMEACTLEGKVYGLPFGMNCAVLFCNEMILKEAGCEEPDTWEEFLETAEACTGTGCSGFSMAGVQSEESMYAFLPMLWSVGQTPEKMDKEAVRKIFNMLEQLTQNGVLTGQCVSMTLTDLMYQFSRGKTAMMINSSMTAAYLKNYAPGLAFDVAPIPSDGKGVTTMGGEILAVSQGGHEEEALEFLRFVAEPERMRDSLEEFGFFAPREDVLEQQYAGNEKMQACMEIFRTAKTREFAPWWPQLSAQVIEALDEVIQGEETEDVLIRLGQETGGIPWQEEE